MFRQPGRIGDEDVTPGKVEGMKRNTYVTVEGCQSLKNHMDVKRMLLINEDLRNEYGDRKKMLFESGVTDIDEYCRRKTDVVLKILKAAGWNELSLEDVRKLNE